VQFKTHAHTRCALRLGFVYEGCFRKDMVVKGVSRDTNWYSLIDDEWPALRRAFDAWLDAGNFDADGRQLRSLEQVRQSVIASVRGTS
jgi:hypothetical protein